MYFDNESETVACIEQLTKEIWITIRKVLQATAGKDEIAGAAERAKFLRLYIDRYDARGFTRLPESTVWIAREVAEAVEDLID